MKRAIVIGLLITIGVIGLCKFSDPYNSYSVWSLAATAQVPPSTQPPFQAALGIQRQKSTQAARARLTDFDKALEAQRRQALAATEQARVQAAQATADAMHIYSQSAEATAQAVIDYKTQVAGERISFETRQAEAVIYATQAAENRRASETAQVEATAQAFTRVVVGWTATASAAESTTVARAQASVSETAASEAARISDLDYKKQSDSATATAEAIGAKTRHEKALSLAWSIFWIALPSSLFITALAIAYRLVWHKTEFTAVQAGMGGKYPLVLRGGKAINPNLQTQAVIDASQPAPQPTPNELRVKENEQKVDSLRALPRNGQQALPQPSQPYTILGPSALPPSHLLEDPAGTVTAVDADWSNRGTGSSE